MTETGKMADKSYTYFEVAEITEIGPRQRLYLEIDDHPVIIFNVDGKLYAIDDECTHDNGPLGDGEIEGPAVDSESPGDGGSPGHSVVGRLDGVGRGLDAVVGGGLVGSEVGGPGEGAGPTVGQEVQPVVRGLR